MRPAFLRLMTIAAVSLISLAAFAHAFLDQAAPPVGGTVPTAPKEIRLTFSEGVEPNFSGIEVTTSDGQAIATGPATRDPADDKKLVVTLPPLASGRYRVKWHVVSVDTHRTEGEYTFTVGP
jgi:methionine-rich copper-binding protein CopC